MTASAGLTASLAAGAATGTVSDSFVGRTSSAGAIMLRTVTVGRFSSTMMPCGNGLWTDSGSCPMRSDAGRGSSGGPVVPTGLTTVVATTIVTAGDPILVVGDAVVDTCNEGLPTVPAPPVSRAVPGVLTAEESVPCGSTPLVTAKKGSYLVRVTVTMITVPVVPYSEFLCTLTSSTSGSAPGASCRHICGSGVFTAVYVAANTLGVVPSSTDFVSSLVIRCALVLVVWIRIANVLTRFMGRYYGYANGYA